jgi:DNA-directed RNA polymerase subunit F
LAERVSKSSRIGGVSQPAISNLEGLESLDRSFQEGTKPGTRETLIEIATLGLGLPQIDVDALLWLFDLKTLDEYEIRYCQQYTPEARPKEYRRGELRTHLLNLLDKWLVKRNAKLARTVKARMIMEWDESAQLEFREELLKIEGKPGQRMIFGKYPSVLNCPNSFGAHRPGGEELHLTEAGRAKAVAVMDERRKLFLTNLTVYGERCIHSKHLISDYLSSSFEHRLNWNQRKEQIENLIRLLKQHEHYEVALTDVEPNSEVEIKSTVAACLRGTERDTFHASNKALICGPLYVYWYDVTTVFSFYRQFERAWDSISEKLRDKDFVIEFLQRALDSAR